MEMVRARNAPSERNVLKGATVMPLGVTLTVEGKKGGEKQHKFDCALVSVGRRHFTDNLGAEVCAVDAFACFPLRLTMLYRLWAWS